MGGLVVGLLLCVLQAASAQSISVVRFEPSETILQPGETTRVTLWIEAAAEIYGVEIHLTYDAASVMIVDGDQGTPGIQLVPGDFLSSEAIFEVANEADNELGQAIYAATLLAPAEPATGEGTLLAFDLLAVAGAEDTLSLSSVILASPDGLALATDVRDAHITVTGEPAPATATPTGAQVERPSPTVPPTQLPAATLTQVIPEGNGSGTSAVTPKGPTLTTTTAPGSGASDQPTPSPEGVEAIPTQSGITPGSTAMGTEESKPEQSVPGSQTIQASTGLIQTQGAGTPALTADTPEAVAVIGQAVAASEGAATGLADSSPEQAGRSATLVILMAALLLLALAILLFLRAHKKS
jgi:hypothetical protein